MHPTQHHQDPPLQPALPLLPRFTPAPTSPLLPLSSTAGDGEGKSDGKKAKAKAEAEAKRAAEAAEVDAWIEAVRGTPAGAKKSLEGEMPKGYVPKAVEAGW